MAQGYDTDQAFPRLGACIDTRALFGRRDETAPQLPECCCGR
jgi:hypothetical protein